eukprot:2090225-Rhodomonas_salina.1
MSDTHIGYASTPSRVLCDVGYLHGLCCYAISGTHIGYAPTRRTISAPEIGLRRRFLEVSYRGRGCLIGWGA